MQPPASKHDRRWESGVDSGMEWITSRSRAYSSASSLADRTGIGSGPQAGGGNKTPQLNDGSHLLQLVGGGRPRVSGARGHDNQRYRGCTPAPSGRTHCHPQRLLLLLSRLLLSLCRCTPMQEITCRCCHKQFTRSGGFASKDQPPAGLPLGRHSCLKPCFTCPCCCCECAY